MVTALASEQAEMQQIPFLNPESTSPLLVQRDVLDQGVDFIQKPFSIMDLAVTVRKVLKS